MRQFGMFAKYWEPGRVKTRLAARLGDAAASGVYRAFLECLVERFGSVGDRRVLVYAPVDCERHFAELAGNRYQLQSQSPGDLGARMQSYFEQAQRGGMQRVVVIGSDSPSLPVSYVDQAFTELEQFPCVLGPSRDGGYYLLGLAGRLPPIFADFPWSTDRVLELTRERLRAAGYTWCELPEWYDVDDADDLATLRGELRRISRDNALKQLAFRLDQLLSPG